jgi:uncharacterized protein (TIGR00369 family)
VDVQAAAYMQDFEQLMRRGIAPPLHGRMGLKLLQVEPVTVLTMEMGEEVRGLAAGSVHGGMLATFADVSAAVSLWRSFDRASQIPITTDLHVRYFRQPRCGPLRAEATVVYRGTRVLSTECSITDAEDRLLARANATYMLAERPPGTR